MKLTDQQKQIAKKAGLAFVIIAVFAVMIFFIVKMFTKPPPPTCPDGQEWVYQMKKCMKTCKSNQTRDKDVGYICAKNCGPVTTTPDSGNKVLSTDLSTCMTCPQTGKYCAGPDWEAKYPHAGHPACGGPGDGDCKGVPGACALQYITDAEMNTDMYGNAMVRHPECAPDGLTYENNWECGANCALADTANPLGPGPYPPTIPTNLPSELQIFAGKSTWGTAGKPSVGYTTGRTANNLEGTPQCPSDDAGTNCVGWPPAPTTNNANLLGIKEKSFVACSGGKNCDNAATKADCDKCGGTWSPPTYFSATTTGVKTWTCGTPGECDPTLSDSVTTNFCIINEKDMKSGDKSWGQSTVAYYPEIAQCLPASSTYITKDNPFYRPAGEQGGYNALYTCPSIMCQQPPCSGGTCGGTETTQADCDTCGGTWSPHDPVCCEAANAMCCGVNNFCCDTSTSNCLTVTKADSTQTTETACCLYNHTPVKGVGGGGGVQCYLSSKLYCSDGSAPRWDTNGYPSCTGNDSSATIEYCGNNLCMAVDAKNNNKVTLTCCGTGEANQGCGTSTMCAADVWQTLPTTASSAAKVLAGKCIGSFSTGIDGKECTDGVSVCLNPAMATTSTLQAPVAPGSCTTNVCQSGLSKGATCTPDNNGEDATTCGAATAACGIVTDPCTYNSDCGLNAECSTCPNGEDPTCVNYYDSTKSGGCTSAEDCTGAQGSSIGGNNCYTWSVGTPPSAGVCSGGNAPNTPCSATKPCKKGKCKYDTGPIGGHFNTTTTPCTKSDGSPGTGIIVKDNNMSALQGACIEDCTTWWAPKGSQTACPKGKQGTDPTNTATYSPLCKGCTPVKCPAKMSCFCNSTNVCQSGLSKGATCKPDKNDEDATTCGADTSSCKPTPSVCTNSTPGLKQISAWPDPTLTGSHAGSYPVWAQVFTPIGDQQCPLNFIQCTTASDCPTYTTVDNIKGEQSTCSDDGFCMAAPASSVQGTAFCPVNFKVDYNQGNYVTKSESNSLNTSFMGAALANPSPINWSYKSPGVPQFCEGDKLSCAGLTKFTSGNNPNCTETVATRDNCGGRGSGTSLSFPFIAGKHKYASPKETAAGASKDSAKMWSCPPMKGSIPAKNNYIGCGQGNQAQAAGLMPTFGGKNPLVDNDWSVMKLVKWKPQQGVTPDAAGKLCLSQALDYVASELPGLQLNSAEWSQTCPGSTLPNKYCATDDDCGEGAPEGSCGVCIAEYNQDNSQSVYCDDETDPACFNNWNTSGTASSPMPSPLYCPNNVQNTNALPGKLALAPGTTAPAQNAGSPYVYMCNSHWPVSR